MRTILFILVLFVILLIPTSIYATSNAVKQESSKDQAVINFAASVCQMEHTVTDADQNLLQLCQSFDNTINTAVPIVQYVCEEISTSYQQKLTQTFGFDICAYVSSTGTQQVTKTNQSQVSQGQAVIDFASSSCQSNQKSSNPDPQLTQQCNLFDNTIDTAASIVQYICQLTPSNPPKIEQAYGFDMCAYVNSLEVQSQTTQQIQTQNTQQQQTTTSEPIQQTQTAGITPIIIVGIIAIIGIAGYLYAHNKRASKPIPVYRAPTDVSQSAGTAFCPNCGAKVDAGERYCANCGADTR